MVPGPRLGGMAALAVPCHEAGRRVVVRGADPVAQVVRGLRGHVSTVRTGTRLLA